MMALDAVHISARSRSPDESDLDLTNWQPKLEASVEHGTVHLRRSSSPSPYSDRKPTGRRPGLGSSPASMHPKEDSDQGWQSLCTGESLASKAARMRHRFVRATYLSDPTQPVSENVLPELESQSAALNIPYVASTEGRYCMPSGPSRASVSTLAQLYSQLAEDMTTSNATNTQPQSSATSVLPIIGSTEELVHRKELDQAQQRAHHRRHHADAWHRSEWFISRALTKMRHTQDNAPSEASTAALQAGNNGEDDKGQPPLPLSRPIRRQRCPRCGDALPWNASSEDMARHRQSIGHRLGLNAPVSSASASEAPSPTTSEAPTPSLRSRSSSPTNVLLPDELMQARHPSPGRLRRRLSNAPRWKKIARNNVGHSILSRMGWKEGMGLGVQEWKWQQNRREKIKRLRLNAIRALLRRHASATPGGPSRQAPVSEEPRAGTNNLLSSHSAESQPESEWLQMLLQTSTNAPAEASSLQAAFPFELEAENAAERHGAAQAWLSNLASADAEWFRYLTVDESNILEQALLSGGITLQDLQRVLWSSTDKHAFGNTSGNEPNPEAAGIEVEAWDDAMPPNALLYPVEVELRTGRSGIGVGRSVLDGSASGSHRRRSRNFEGTIEIRRQTSPFTGEHISGSKRPRSVSNGRPAKPPARSRSHSGGAGGGNSRRHSQHVDLTRRQRELAYQKDKRDWLNLRASLS